MSSKSPRNPKRSKASKPKAVSNVPQHVSSAPSSSSSSSSSDDDDPSNEPEAPENQPAPSFGERLKILNLKTTQSTHVGPPSEPDGQEGLKKLRTPSAAAQPIMPVGSLGQTLVQALNSADARLLETCLLQSNKALIAATLRRLPKPLVHNLIEQLVLCLNRKKRGLGDGATVSTVRRTKTLIEWVRQVLLIHMSYLLTIPTLVTQLSVLHASLQKRLNLHTKLLSLNGRLELVLSQIDLNKTAAAVKPIGKQDALKPATKAQPVAQAEPFRYVEGESSTSEQEAGSEEDSSSNEEVDELKMGSDEEGSVEDVVLASESDEEDSSSDDGELNLKPKRRVGDTDALLDLEAEVSGSDPEDDEDEDDEDEDDEDDEDEDEEMAGFIDDGSEESGESSSEEE